MLAPALRTELISQSQLQEISIDEDDQSPQDNQEESNKSMRNDDASGDMSALPEASNQEVVYYGEKQEDEDAEKLHLPNFDGPSNSSMGLIPLKLSSANHTLQMHKPPWWCSLAYFSNTFHKSISI